MKQIKIIISIFCLLTLIACPASHFHDYEYIGKSESKKLNNEIKPSQIKCGYLSRFIEGKEQVLLVRINSIADNSIQGVTSKQIGNLNKVEPSKFNGLNMDSLTVFKKDFKIKNETKILKMLKNDTIIIEFKNGMKYYFQKK
ncbi:hypothetical protein [Chryseobacterium sp. MP_3.2]|uniref:hypothetical protein n=1 Tax=Chryseobacterium sp. MP_3.2 TaxID=3071712 RepID=UPI002E0781A4|nr:hypothetical protein [Chryseobacterium sp. MP_3.2]